MVEINYYLTNDWFKIGRSKEQQIKQINLGLLASLGAIVLSLSLMGLIYSSTNYSNLDDLELYIDNYGKKENRFFDGINLALKVMPNYNTERNAIFMKHSNDVASKIPNSQVILDTYGLNNTYFYVNKTKMIFPKLDFNRDSIPVGDSVQMCLTISWAEKDHGLNYDVMKVVQGFPRCSETISDKFIWNSNDPVNGIDIPVWFQRSYDIDCGDETECIDYCKNTYNAEFINGKKGKKCYAYDILDNICVVVEWDSISRNYKYVGGCYKDGKTSVYTPAEIKTLHRFDKIEIEVRNKRDPIIKAGELSDYEYNFGLGWHYFVVLLGFVVNICVLLLFVIAAYTFYLKKTNTGNSGLIDNENNDANDIGVGGQARPELQGGGSSQDDVNDREEH